MCVAISLEINVLSLVHNIDADVVINSAAFCSQYLETSLGYVRQGWSPVSSQIAHACLIMDNGSNDDLLLLLLLQRQSMFFHSRSGMLTALLIPKNAHVVTFDADHFWFLTLE